MADKEKLKKSCQCKNCQAACSHRPGWMKPGEAEKIAAFMGLTLKEFFANYLAVDWWEKDEINEDIFLLMPGITRSPTGTEMPSNPKGICVFLKNGKCSIHEVKPFECREAWCEMEDEETQANHKEAAMAWIGHQEQVKELLGREPMVKSYSLLDYLNSFSE